MRQSIFTGLQPRITMTPALRQAIRMLQLSSQALRVEARQMSQSNPLLEVDEEDTEAGADEVNSDTPAEAGLEDDIAGEVEADYSAVTDAVAVVDGPLGGASAQEMEAYLSYRTASIHNEVDLREYLRGQLAIESTEESVRLAALYIIDSLDDDGFIQRWPTLRDTLSDELALSEHDIERGLATVQRLEPSGVGARSVSESLRLQLVAERSDDPAMEWALVLLDSQVLDALLSCRKLDIEGELDLTPEQAEHAVELITSLNPRPGSQVGAGQPRYIEPEVYAHKRGRDWIVGLNTQALPKVRINHHYAQMVERDNARTRQDDTQRYLRRHYQDAKYFISSLHSRNDTLLRVARAIVEHQRDFLEWGPQYMRPLVLRDIADELGIHESTVSRATSSKYISTPRGVFELKQFFSSSVASVGGEMVSATSVQALMCQLVREEDALSPYSDHDLAQALASRGIRVARRTIAKYRVALHIPPSNERRCLAKYRCFNRTQRRDDKQY